MKYYILLVLLCLSMQFAHAEREKREEKNLTRAEHSVKLVCYQNKETFEVEVLIDGERVFTAHQVPENLIAYTFTKLEGRLDEIIADYEDNLEFFGAIDG